MHKYDRIISSSFNLPVILLTIDFSMTVLGGPSMSLGIRRKFIQTYAKDHPNLRNEM